MKPKTKQSIRSVLIVLAVLVAVDLTPLGGNLRMYAKWMQCGTRPMQSGVTFAGQVQNYKQAEVLTGLRGHSKYFCTPREAELAGYSITPDMHKFPHLSEGEVRQAIKKSYGD